MRPMRIILLTCLGCGIYLIIAHVATVPGAALRAGPAASGVALAADHEVTVAAGWTADRGVRVGPATRTGTSRDATGRDATGRDATGRDATGGVVFRLLRELEDAAQRGETARAAEILVSLEMLATTGIASWRTLARYFLALADLDVRIRAALHDLLLRTAPSSEAAALLAERLRAPARAVEEAVLRDGPARWTRTVLDPADPGAAVAALQATPAEWLVDPRLLDVLVLLLDESEHTAVRMQALYRLGLSRDVSLIPGLQRRIQTETDALVRAGLVRALGGVGSDDPGVAGLFREILASDAESAAVQRFAAHGLARAAVGDGATIRVLAAASRENPDDQVRLHAMMALMAWSGESRDSRDALILSLAADINAAIVTDIAGSLAYSADPEAGRRVVERARACAGSAAQEATLTAVLDLFKGRRSR